MSFEILGAPYSPPSRQLLASISHTQEYQGKGQGLKTLDHITTMITQDLERPSQDPTKENQDPRIFTENGVSPQLQLKLGDIVESDTTHKIQQQL